jgi:ubiquinone/menaquinone biosynthesis C-methylase UbiE
VYPIVEGIPVFLLPEKEQTIGIAQKSLTAAQSLVGGPLYLDTIGLSDKEKQGIMNKWEAGAIAIDPVVSYLVGATSGCSYKNLIGQTTTYPIPNIPLPNGDGRMLLDVGSSWGRWSISAARKGWRVIAIDPSLGALLAAKRAFANEFLNIDFVCGDARIMPFKENKFSAVFSYSVIQHFSEDDAARTIAEVGRLLAPGGEAKIQMANAHGFRSTYVRTRKNYLGGGNFRVRYWLLPKLKKLFAEEIGPTTISAEAFGGLGLLAEDWWVVNGKAKILIVVSLLLRMISRAAPVLVRFADSVYLSAHKH